MKSEYAELYLSLHNEYIREIWENREDDFFLELLNGNHGYCHDLGDGNLELEIKKRQSYTGNPVLFQFPKSLLLEDE